MIQNDKYFLLFGLGAGQRSWRGMWLLAWLYLGTLGFAALLAPPAFWLIQAWFQAAPNELNSYLAHKGFDTYFGRFRYLGLLIALPWILTVCRLWSLRRLGLLWGSDDMRRFATAFVAGFGLLLAVAAIQLWATPSAFRGWEGAERVAWILLRALAGGVVVALLEEIVFRGLILRLFYTALGPVLAVVLGSLFFSYAHFKMPSDVWERVFPVQAAAQAVPAEEVADSPPPRDAQRVKWWSGFFVAFWTLFGITRDFALVPFLSYFALGVALSVLTLRLRTLMPAVGLHAGIVFAMLAYKNLCYITDGGLFFGSGRLVDGLLVLGLLTLVAAGCVLLPMRPDARNS